MTQSKRIQEVFKGKGQATMTQSRYVPNVFRIEYQRKGQLRFITMCADWQARAYCKGLVAR